VEYLGYDPISKEYASIISGYGSPDVQLRAQPISEISSLKVDGVSLDPDDFISDKERIINKNLDLCFTEGTNNVLVSYTAGYKDEEVPGTIKLTILRIAALMLSETGGNIGITSKSFDQGGSRTFTNTRDYSPYLKVLDPIRVERI